MDNNPQVALTTIEIPVPNGNKQVVIRAGDAFMVAGPNGVGKSALLYTIYRQIGAGRAEYYAGHRQITFNNGWDNISQDMDQLKTNFYTHVDVFNRYKNHWAEDMFKSVVRRISNLDATHNAKIASLVDNGGSAAKDFKDSNPGPVAMLNSVFASARMAVRFTPSGRGLRATRSGMEYDIDQLSDGERAALLIAGAVIVQDPFTIIAIDEPERNLHPSIASPLVNVLMLSRPDVGFLFASHDMNLISAVKATSILYVKNSQVVSSRPEMRVFEVHEFGALENVNEDLRLDLLGSRQDILFIEGETTSIDFQIYNAIFDGWKVVPKGGAEQVTLAVKALSGNPDLHWVKVAGLIDRDGKNPEEIEKLSLSRINAITTPTAENLLFLAEVVLVVAEVLHQTEGGATAQERLVNANASISSLFQRGKDEIIARIATWRINRKISEQKVSVSAVRENSAVVCEIDPQQVKREVEQEISEAMAKATDLAHLESLPIKDTNIPGGIAAAIGCNYERYKNIVFRQIALNGAPGRRIKSAISDKIPDLAITSKAE